MIRVYRFRLRPPTEGQEIVREQIRLENRYRNDLCSIERGRRAAIRELEDSPEVQEAFANLKASTRSTRKEAMRALSRARRAARERASECRETDRMRSAQSALAALALVSATSGLPAPKLVHAEAKRELRRARAEAGDQLSVIALLDEEIRGNAYEHSSLLWGSKLTVHAAHDQFRRTDLYDDDGVTPRDPKYRRSGAIRYWPDQRWSFGDGQVSVHVQNRTLTTEDATGGQDAWIRIGPERRPMLSLRIGSDGRRPIWASWPIATSADGKRKELLPRAMRPGKITWARVRCSHSGPRGEGQGFGTGEVWECSITVDEETPSDIGRVPAVGTIAIEVCWDKPREHLIAARWHDSRGGGGTVPLPSSIVSRLESASHVRSVRDVLMQSALTGVQRLLLESRHEKPLWLLEAAGTLHLWKNAARLHDLVRRWRWEKCDAAREAYDRLQEWEVRDAHLWALENGRRKRALGYRLDFYRNLARQWERTYEHVILDDRQLNREARFGEQSDLRFQAGPAELRGAITHAFGRNRVQHFAWKEEVSEEDDRHWCERAIDAHLRGAAREGRKPKRTVHGAGGAWGSRLSGQAKKAKENGVARKPIGNVSE